MPIDTSRAVRSEVLGEHRNCVLELLKVLSPGRFVWRVSSIPQKGCCTGCGDVGTSWDQVPILIGVFCFSIYAKREQKEAALENLGNRFLNARRNLTPRI